MPGLAGEGSILRRDKELSWQGRVGCHNGMPIELTRTIDWLAVVYAALYFPVPVYWLLIHPAVKFWRRVGYRSFWIALPVWISFGLPLVLIENSLFVHRLPRSAATDCLGAALLALNFWVGRRVHQEFSFKKLAGLPEVNPEHPLQGIVCTGIYSQVRHPRYANIVLGFIAFAVLTGAAGIFLLAFATFLLYLIVTPLEERELREQYGTDYESYARTVPRFLPYLWRRSRK
jgi:protein-S-isoprenylcysteine O-methyltransferase Ste14